MTSDRPYRAAMEYLVARDRLLQAMGSQFYTDAVVAFLSILATATPNYKAARGTGSESLPSCRTDINTDWQFVDVA